jgi:hypothetical protein
MHFKGRDNGGGNHVSEWGVAVEGRQEREYKGHWPFKGSIAIVHWMV